MMKRMLSMLAVVALVAGTAPVARAELAGLGTPIDPHGFPAYYQDANGLQLELCLPAPAGHASRPELCIFDALDLESDLIVAGEVFWWLAGATIDNITGGGRAGLTLGVEGTFGGPEAPVDGQQIAFGRVRIRVDTPIAGTYIVTHPYGEQSFEVAEADLADGINYTADIGAANFRDPTNGFRGALSSSIGPFLTWENYTQNPALQVLELDGLGQPTGVILEQYVGDPNVLAPVVGSPFDTNVFRVEGPQGFETVETDLFSLMGKVYDASQPQVAHVFPEVPFPILYAVGPVNRVVPFAEPTTATVTGVDIANYPVGYPLWYQENGGTIAEPAPGLKFTLCNPGQIDPLNPLVPANPMCISDPIDPADNAHLALRSGGEGFWWSAGASFANGDDDLAVEFALEATFGGDESVTDGGQISFARERIRIDTVGSGAGTYRITHPYGERIFEDVPADVRGINYTGDVGINNPADPDGAFAGALYHLGPQLLKWVSFHPDPALTDPRLIKPDLVDPALTNYFVGDPAIESEVTGSPTGNNFFRVEKLLSGTVTDGTWELLGETDQFLVSGQLFVDPGPGPGDLVLPFVIGTYEQGSWLIDLNTNGSWDGTPLDLNASFGTAAMLPVTGDWNNDGTTEIGAYEDGTWYLDLNGNGAWDGTPTDAIVTFGTSAMTPVTGDWNNDGIAEIGAYEDGTWYLDLNGNGAWDGTPTDAIVTFGTSAMTPITGDWNGDGTTEVGAYEDGTWYLDLNGNGSWDGTPTDRTATFGTAAMLPVTGDWNNDGTTEIGAFENGSWYLDLDNSGTWDGPVTDLMLSFGAAGALPVSGQ